MAIDGWPATWLLGLLVVVAPVPGVACVSEPPADMAWVAGRQIVMADDPMPAAAPAATSGHPVAVRGYWLGRHEISNREFARFAAATGHVTTAERTAAGQLPQGSFLFQHVQRLRLDSTWWRRDHAANWRRPQGEGSDWANIPDHPVVHVTLADALAYAHWAGGTLPSEAQWEHAAAKASRRVAGAPVGNTWQGEFPTQDTAADGHAGTAPVGSYAPDGLGLYDLLGNVWELTSSLDATGQRAVIKGGSFLCNARFCDGARPQARQWQQLDSSAAHVGFRLAALPCR